MSIFVVILLFLLLSAFFSGSEIAFVSASKVGVEIKKEEGSSRGKILGRFYDKPEGFLGTMLVGNNISLVVITYFATELLEPWFSSFISNELILLLTTTLIITIVVLIFGEYLPKTFFRLYSNQVLFMMAYPLRLFQVILAIPSWIMLSMTNILMRPFIKSPDKNLTEALTRLDLHHYIDETISDFNEDIDKEIFTNALHLNQLKVRNCLVPRPEVIHFDIGGSVDDLISLFRKTKVSRILIIDGDIEVVKGYIHHQQLLSNPAQIKEIVMEIPYVPEAMNARDLMLRFIRESTNIACVVDEYGSISGIITLEDILEEIFGEIEDEHDGEEYIEKQISADEYLFSGRLEIDYINENYPNLNIPEGEYHTLSGYLVMTSGKIPEATGELIQLNGLDFIVEKLGDTRVETVRVRKISAEKID